MVTAGRNLALLINAFRRALHIASEIICNQASLLPTSMASSGSSSLGSSLHPSVQLNDIAFFWISLRAMLQFLVLPETWRTPRRPQLNNSCQPSPVRFNYQ
jgi:hypothetical protein